MAVALTSKLRSSDFRDASAIHYATDGTLEEFHDVLSECASFVGEDVFDVAQCLIKVGCAGIGTGVGDWIVDFGVIVDEEDLT